MLGEYEGGESIAELLRLGDFGVGTLDHLDGELIVLDGRAYQVRGDGQVLDVDPTRTTPFATVTHFAPDGEMPCPRVKRLAELDEALDDALGRKNAFLAVKIHGRFESIVLRSVARQEPPYRPLAEVAKSQSVWTHANVSGTLVGIRSPAWAVGMNVPGYHWHFLSDDHNLGGHVLDCRVDEARVAYEVGRDWLVKLQDSAAFNALNLRADQSRELKRVESARGE